MSKTKPKGPPKENKNAEKHGYFTRKEIEKRKAIHGLIRDMKNITEKLK